MSWATVSFSFGNPVASEYMELTLTAPTAALHEGFKWVQYSALLSHLLRFDLNLT